MTDHTDASMSGTRKNPSPDEAQITAAELVEMFGSEMPIEAVNLLWDGPDYMGTAELRTRLRAIAAAIRAIKPEDSK